MSAWYIFSALGFYPIALSPPSISHLRSNCSWSPPAPKNLYIKSVSVDRKKLATRVRDERDAVDIGLEYLGECEPPWTLRTFLFVVGEGGDEVRVCRAVISRSWCNAATHDFR
ncbi:hypothetical protein L227DRAFT_581335 [Lentinus tigrinus ALCF2SS1-6]|uniref:Glycosyl hydrolase family 92 domain-containing protein n=2 Tax=Lentinus tigrinus TaxID=5365 RepID=A0A5C2RQI7_9APHY|nr:hypothetical protein L227DRAFT_581335 [Lentinus tigrinus ALCF2SS1-6]